MNQLNTEKVNNGKSSVIHIKREKSDQEVQKDIVKRLDALENKLSK